MQVEILPDPDADFIDFISNKLSEFNWQNWEVNERLPLAAQVKNDQGEVVAGATARTFGNWLLLDRLWVCESQRGEGLGTQLLQQVEAVAIERGCRRALLDTLNFQAQPFYQRHGYETQWVQQDYPKTGCRYFMVKELTS